MRTRALVMLRKASKVSAHRPQLDFITLAIQGKQQGFEKVIKMIDDMVGTLKQEQLDDDHKQEYCAKQFDFADDKKKGLERKITDLETVIEEAKEGIAATKTEIENLKDSIK